LFDAKVGLNLFNCLIIGLFISGALVILGIPGYEQYYPLAFKIIVLVIIGLCLGLGINISFRLASFITTKKSLHKNN